MSIGIIIVLLVGAALMMFGFKNRASSWGRPLALGASVFILIFAGIQMKRTLTPSPEALMTPIFNRFEINGRVLGRYLAETYPGATAVVVVASDTQSQNLLRGLTQGVGTDLKITRTLKVPQTAEYQAPREPNEPEPLTAFLKAQNIQEDLIILTLEAPSPFTTDTELDFDQIPAKWVLAAGPSQGLSQPMARGQVVAALARNPDGESWKTYHLAPTGSDDEEFHRFHVLVTPENINALRTRHADLF